MRTWLRNVRWGAASTTPVDVLLADGRVAAVVAAGGAPAGPDLGGARVLAGIHDHHLHLLALAAQQRSLVLSAQTTPAAWRRLIAATPVGADGWVRVTGAHESITGDLDAVALDAVRGDVPVRVQHRTGMLWVLNSAALRAIAPLDHAGAEHDAAGHATGRLWRADDWLRQRTPATTPDLATIGRLLLAHGITAVTDASPDLDAHTADLLATAGLPQRITLLGAPDGWRSPNATAVGARKLVLDDAALPDLDELVARIRGTRAQRRAVAVHCVSAQAAHYLLLALREAGGVHRGDRIEHGSVLPREVIQTIAAAGITVVTQPAFLSDRGDRYLADVDSEDLEQLYPIGALHRAGVRVRFSSDAPYGPIDPARWLRDAVLRRTAGGAVVGQAQRLTWEQAADVMQLTPRVGMPADLVLVTPGLRERVLGGGALGVEHVLIGGVEQNTRDSQASAFSDK